MKAILALATTLALAFTLTACGSNKKKEAAPAAASNFENSVEESNVPVVETPAPVKGKKKAAAKTTKKSGPKKAKRY